MIARQPRAFGRAAPPALVAALVLTLLAPAALSAGELGAFIALVNTSGYADGPRRGTRVPVKSRVAVPVVNQSFDEGDKLWYQVLLTDRTELAQGQGWTPLTPEELRALGAEPTLIFDQPLGAAERTPPVLRVRAGDVRVLPEAEPGESQPRITWRRVRYATRLAPKAWVRAGTGIYRAGKADTFLTQSYADMVTHAVPKDTLIRLLSGVVRVGDRPEEVRWALGAPRATREETADAATFAVWEYPELTVRFQDDALKSIQ